MVAVVNETLVNTFWKGQNPIGQRLRPCCGDQSAVVHGDRRGQGREAGRRRSEDRARSSTSSSIRPRSAPPPLSNAPGTMNVVLRTTLPPATLRQTIEGAVREADPSVPIVRLREMDARVRRVDPPSAAAGAAARRLRRAWRCCWPRSAPTACCRTWWPSAGARSASAWRSARRSAACSAQVMKQGLVLTGVGIVVGLAGAFALNRLIASLLFGVQPTDPITMVGGRRDDHARRRGRLLAAGVARVESRSEHRAAAGLTRVLGSRRTDPERAPRWCDRPAGRCAARRGGSHPDSGRRTCRKRRLHAARVACGAAATAVAETR